MTGLAGWSARIRQWAPRWSLPALAWSLWLLTGSIVPQLAQSRQALRLAVDAGGWQPPGWVLLPLAVVALNGLWAARRGLRSACVTLRVDLARLALPAALLAGLRLLSLWRPAGTVWPWLGLAWSPHASVALAGVALLLNRAATPAPGAFRRPLRGPGRRAATLGVGFGLLYAGYTLYICQMTMLHGDETQYLRVTQSLLRDGDLDLADDLDLEHALEYHVMQVGVHPAPGAPEGRLYSKHPVGLSVLLVPAYQAGLRAWSNPRLGAALFMALCTAGVVALLCLWLDRLGFAPGTGVLVTLLVATTAPLLLFSTQLYPEVPALLILLLVLLRLPAHLLGAPPSTCPPAPQTTGCPHSLELAALTALLGALPFLHPRYAPAAALLGLGLLRQAQRSPRRGLAWLAVGATTLGVAVLLVRRNLAFSGDWLGNFRPGAAWDENAISPVTWWSSLPGQWVHAGKGLALNAPWYFVAAVAGIATLARHRDRRLLTAAALYGTTAVVNGVHPDWTFGFCLPARFVVTALPALSLVAAAGLEACRGRRAALLLLVFAATLAWDTLWPALQLPELAFQGEHVARADLAGYYPFTAHAVPQSDLPLTAADATFWVAAAATVVLLVMPRGRLVVAALVLLSLAPAAWGHSATATTRLRYAIPHSVRPLVQGDVGQVGTVTSTLGRLRNRTTGEALEEGGYLGQGDDEAGLLAGFFLPVQQPGLYRIDARGVEVEGTQMALLEHRRVLPATQPWARRRSVPITGMPHGRFQIDGYLTSVRLGYLDFAFSGHGRLRLGPLRLDFHPARLWMVAVEAARIEVEEGTERPALAVSQRLDPGRYRARFEVDGSALATLTARLPAPVQIAVALPAERADFDGARLRSWFEGDRRLSWVEAHPEALRPQREALMAPWRVGLPVLGRRESELTFLVRRPGTVWFLYRYDGPASLVLRRIVIDRLHVEKRPPR